MSVYVSVAARNECILLISLVLRGSIISKCSLRMCGKVREFDHDWRVATLKFSARDAGDFNDAAGEREMAPKCGSLPRHAGDLVGLLQGGLTPHQGLCPCRPVARIFPGGGPIPPLPFLPLPFPLPIPLPLPLPLPSPIPLPLPSP